ncbi:class I SAM-dependent methyltransferase [Methanobacterium sp.]|uniref:class I SAM-dependent methyltransferase n=1 Tax=Methanobacterium sp. TaxID=2164 RepID=UPI003C78D3E2
MKKSDKVKAHFEEESAEFDEIIRKLIPHYKDMINALISSIPFEHDAPVKVLDLGCGTGTVTKTLKEEFKKADVTCLDLAENMIEMAKIKLKDYNDIEYVIGDFYDYNFTEKYDVIVSSLALHHLATDEDKKGFYKKIYEALRHGGIFLNADAVLGSSKYLQDLYTSTWKKFMNQSISMEEIEKKWIPAAEEEDHPAKLIDHIDWLRDTGFKDVDVIWKYYHLAVYGGYKQ